MTSKRTKKSSKNKTGHERLPITFHRTFIPERRYITALLHFAAQGGAGSDLEISTQTGIPVGKSDGKVPAIVGYCLGMGLITTTMAETATGKQFDLTPFGRAILLEDPHISEPLSQWLMHFFLCRKIGGAEIWYHTFATGHDILGNQFDEKQLKAYLEGICGKRKRSLIGPLIRMYQELSAFKAANILSVDSRTIVRSPAPQLSSFRNGYAALFLFFWDNHFPEERQITFSDFEQETCWRKIGGWSEQQGEIILNLIQDTGAVDVDKQMQPWVISRLAHTEQFWPILFDELS